MEQQDLYSMIISTSLLVFLLVTIMAIAFVLSARQRMRQEMRLAETKLSYEQELRRVENEVAEELMSRFAQELHDNIGQLHTAMNIQIQNQKLDHPEYAEKLGALEAYLGEANRQLKILSRTLNYDYLGHAGLLHSIELETERLKQLKRVEVDLHRIGNISPLNKNQELLVFRIFQEVVQNCLKHADAKRLELRLECSENKFDFRISDDGKGFNTENTLASERSNGLRNIMKRSAMAGLKTELQSSPGKGTSYRIHLS